MNDGSAYQSRLILNWDTDGVPEPVVPWQQASAVTDATDPELAELRRRVVDPVVTSVLTADELDSVVVFESPGQDIRVTVVARGEESFHSLHRDRSVSVDEDDLSGMAAQFANELEDFVAESAFAWATQRTAVYAIPPA